MTYCLSQTMLGCSTTPIDDTPYQAPIYNGTLCLRTAFNISRQNTSVEHIIYLSLPVELKTIDRLIIIELAVQ